MIVAGYLLPDGPGENSQKLSKEISQCVRRARSLLTRLRKSSQNPYKKAKILDTAENSKSLLVAARLEANRRLKTSSRESASSLLEGANPIYWNFNPVETVKVWAKQKPGGNYRPICRFGLNNMMMLQAGRMILSAEFTPKPWQCDYGNGLGHKGLHFAVKSAHSFSNSGWHFAAKADVVKFFPSFDVTECQKVFPDHKKMIGQYLGSDHMLMECSLPKGMPTTDILKEARRGGLVGSPFTAIIGGRIMSKLVWSGPALLLNYADDFLILGKTKLEVDTALADLKAKIEALPGGHFKMHKSQVVHLSEGITFLGHEFVLEEGKGRIRCAQVAWDNFYFELQRRLPDLSKLHIGTDKSAIEHRLGETWLYAKSWGNAFKLCEDVAEYLDTAKAGIEVDAGIAGISWHAIDAYRDPSVGFKHPYAA